MKFGARKGLQQDQLVLTRQPPDYNILVHIPWGLQLFSTLLDLHF